MRHEEIYKIFKDVVETHKLTMKIDFNSFTCMTTITFKNPNNEGYTKSFDKWWEPLCRDNLIKLRDDVERYYYKVDSSSLKVYKHDDHLDTMIYGRSIIDALKPTCVPAIKNVIFNDPATIILWADGTKTVVKCQDGDIYDPEKGMAMAICKKALGNQGNYCEVFKKWLPEEEEVECLYPDMIKFEAGMKTIGTFDIQKAFEDFIAQRTKK